MKLKVTFLMLFFCAFVIAQNINFTDPNFKNFLVNSNTTTNAYAYGSNSQPMQIDTNSDGEISFSEAANVYAFMITGSNINVIDNMQNFTNVQYFYIMSDSSITSINLSNSSIQGFIGMDLSSLNSLVINNSTITTVTVSTVPLLSNLSITNCATVAEVVVITAPILPAINLNNLPNLGGYGIMAVPAIQTLDLSSFPMMTNVGLYDLPQLTSINAHNGSHETSIDLSNLPLLSTVCADSNEITDWQSALSLAGINAVVSNCTALNTKEIEKTINKPMVFPNPTKDWVTIKSNDEITKVEVYDLSGKRVQTHQTTKFDMSELTKGIYVIKMTGKNGIYNTKVIKN